MGWKNENTKNEDGLCFMRTCRLAYTKLIKFRGQRVYMCEKHAQQYDGR